MSSRIDRRYLSSIKREYEKERYSIFKKIGVENWIKEFDISVEMPQKLNRGLTQIDTDKYNREN